ncbi:hypothetical protein Amet_3315 [Alkaliphilus metalliredigens QYMF]|uniref:Adhesin domain-containing protein n=1 Tax=Alkaliphilus metalliredigens (strain QYMF) TaxID=293826 RepID=A6TTC5_ALKMQ|nr:hypothetical protein [Alkaliphilus metalliredigens]ABR49443.1 hypothetical protein Amet_3315 [Alkaliphilus metalliredigens QYMF]
MPKAASFNTDVKTTSGKIEIGFPVTVQGDIDKNNVKGIVGDGNDHQVNINTVSGSVSIETHK